jgi:hypothetical protein
MILRCLGFCGLTLAVMIDLGSAGCATPIGFAGHAPASAAANSQRTFHSDHSMGADQMNAAA